MHACPISKVWSLLMGDKENKWRIKPFQMSNNGAFWVPPPLPEKHNGKDSDEEDSSAKARERERRKVREEMRKER